MLEEIIEELQKRFYNNVEIECEYIDNKLYLIIVNIDKNKLIKFSYGWLSNKTFEFNIYMIIEQIKKDILKLYYRGEYYVY